MVGKYTESKEIKTLRFTRVPFGLTSCENREPDHPDIVQEIRRSLYVDDLIGGGETTNKAQNLKRVSHTILGEACFELNKWHSNEPALEINSQLDNEPEQSYSKEQLSVQKGETKLLGIPRDKREDTIGVTFPTESAEPTKRNIL